MAVTSPRGRLLATALLWVRLTTVVAAVVMAVCAHQRGWQLAILPTLFPSTMAWRGFFQPIHDSITTKGVDDDVKSFSGRSELCLQLRHHLVVARGSAGAGCRDGRNTIDRSGNSGLAARLAWTIWILVCEWCHRGAGCLCRRDKVCKLFFQLGQAT